MVEGVIVEGDDAVLLEFARLNEGRELGSEHAHNVVGTIRKNGPDLAVAQLLQVNDLGTKDRHKIGTRTESLGWIFKLWVSSKMAACFQERWHLQRRASRFLLIENGAHGSSGESHSLV